MLSSCLKMYMVSVFNMKRRGGGSRVGEVKSKGQVSELALSGEDGIFQWRLGD